MVTNSPGAALGQLSPMAICLQAHLIRVLSTRQDTHPHQLEVAFKVVLQLFRQRFSGLPVVVTAKLSTSLVVLIEARRLIIFLNSSLPLICWVGEVII